MNRNFRPVHMHGRLGSICRVGSNSVCYLVGSVFEIIFGGFCSSVLVHELRFGSSVFMDMVLLGSESDFSSSK